MGTARVRDFVKYGRKIIGVGLNYRSTLCWKNAPIPDEPAIFVKPPSSYIVCEDCIKIPKCAIEIHQEVELGVVMGKKGKHIREQDAYDFVGGYCLALDMTDMGYLEKARCEGGPWGIAKGFDTACPVSRLVTKRELKNPQSVRIYSKLNCAFVQDCYTNDMIFTIPQLIAYISQFMTLEPCDMILTGAPAGTACIKHGDRIEVGLGECLRVDFDVRDDC